MNQYGFDTVAENLLAVVVDAVQKRRRVTPTPTSKAPIMPKLTLPSAYEKPADTFILAGLPQGAIFVKK
jgi:hypothetical protein